MNAQELETYVKESERLTLEYVLDPFAEYPDGAVAAEAAKQRDALMLKLTDKMATMTLTDIIREFEMMVVKAGMETRRNREKTVTASVTRHYGAVSVTFGLTEKVMCVNDTHVRIAYELLLDDIRDQFRRYESEHLSKINALPAAAAAAPSASQADGHDVVDATKISVEVKNGKVFHKVHGGRWMKYGVTIWPEVLARSGILAADIPVTGLDLTGYTATILMTNGKPDKVLKLEKA